MVWPLVIVGASIGCLHHERGRNPGHYTQKKPHGHRCGIATETFSDPPSYSNNEHQPNECNKLFHGLLSLPKIHYPKGLLHHYDPHARDCSESGHKKAQVCGPR